VWVGEGGRRAFSASSSPEPSPSSSLLSRKGARFLGVLAAAAAAAPCFVSRCVPPILHHGGLGPCASYRQTGELFWDVHRRRSAGPPRAAGAPRARARAPPRGPVV